LKTSTKLLVSAGATSPWVGRSQQNFIASAASLSLPLPVFRHHGFGDPNKTPPLLVAHPSSPISASYLVFSSTSIVYSQLSRFVLRLAAVYCLAAASSMPESSVLALLRRLANSAPSLLHRIASLCLSWFCLCAWCRLLHRQAWRVLRNRGMKRRRFCLRGT
jgi:hypothetical protein